MANHPSALKRNRQAQKRRARNRTCKSEIATITKKLLQAPVAEVGKIAVSLQSKIDKAARKGTIHWKAAARRVSRLAKKTAAAVK